MATDNLPQNSPNSKAVYEALAAILDTVPEDQIWSDRFLRFTYTTIQAKLDPSIGTFTEAALCKALDRADEILDGVDE